MKRLDFVELAYGLFQKMAVISRSKKENVYNIPARDKRGEAGGTRTHKTS